MISLLDYLTKDKILCNINGDYKDILKEIINTTLNNYSEKTKEKAINTLFKRENYGSTNIGQGFAIEHGRIDNLDKINVGLALLKNKYSGLAGGPIEVVICIIVPTNKNRVYLSLLAHISRVLSHPEAKEIFKCENADKIIEFIKRVGY